MSTAIKVASFNLKHDSPLCRGNRWEQRRDLVTQIIQQSGAAVIGVQEMMPAMKEDLRLRLEGYDFLGVGRTKKLTDEQSAILVHRDSARAESVRTFWLSKHPDKQGSRAYYAVFPRICTVSEIYINAWGRKIRVFNTHFDHICAPARTLSVRLILETMYRLNQREALPTLLMGDLNAGPHSKAIRILTENRHSYPGLHLVSLYEATVASSIRSTYHSFRGRERRAPIDYMFLSDEFQVKGAYVNTFRQDGRYPSDHYPLVALLELKA